MKNIDFLKLGICSSILLLDIAFWLTLIHIFWR